MLQSIKRLTKHSVIYGIGHIFSRSIGFLLLPILSNYLIPKEMGTVALLFSSLAILNILFGYGMDVAFLRYYILEDNKEGRMRIFSTAFLMILSTGILFAGLIMLFPGQLSLLIFRTADYSHLITLGAGILLADALVLIPFLVLRSEEKSVQFGLLRLLNVLANVGMNILFVIILKKGVTGVFTANLIASTFTLITVLPIIVRLLRPLFHTKILKDLLSFGLPYVPSMLSVLVMDQISRFFLDRMIGQEATGIFSANYKLGMIMAFVVAAFRFAWHPFLLSTSKEKNAPQIFARILTYFLAITGIFFLVITFFLKQIIHIKLFGITILGSAYESGIVIVPVILLAYVFYGVYVNLIVGIYLKKKTAYMPLITGTGALVSLIANYTLIPVLGIMGAAYATFLAYFSMALMLYLFSRKLYPIPYEGIRIIKLVLVFGLLYFVGIQILNNTHFLYRLIPLFITVPLLWIIGFFNEDEKKRFKSFLNKVSRVS